MKRSEYIRMPSGSIVRVDDDRLHHVDHPNAMIINFAAFIVAAFVLGFVLLAVGR